MPFQILKGNLISVPCDAMINPTDESCSGSGGLDAQIHRAAGPELASACRAIVPLAEGSAALTPAGMLPCRFLIHTVAPWWTGQETEILQLRGCYRRALSLAEEHGFHSLGFPLIGSGTRGFPKELVLRVAAEEIGRFLARQEDCDVVLVIHDMSEFQPDPALLAGLERFIQRVHREGTVSRPAPEDTLSFPAFSARPDTDDAFLSDADDSAPYSSESFQTPEAPMAAESAMPEPKPGAKGKKEGLPWFRRARDKVQEVPAHSLPLGSFEPNRELVLDESFSQMVLRKIEERGFQKDSECYTRANIDRRLFSRLRCDENYHPKKTTALALAVALELPLSETRELLMKAGYSLSHSILFDVIVEYCILRGNYDIFEINELLFQYDQPLLGG